MRKRLVALALLITSALVVAAQAPGYVPPPGANVPKVGAKAPNFTLPDTAGKSVELSELLVTPAPGASNSTQKGAWVLMIFYRGYW